MGRLVAIGVLLLLVSCEGGGDQPSVLSLQSSDGSGIQAVDESTAQSLDEALAELDALTAPEGVDAALFERLRDELAAQLAAKSRSGRFVSQAPDGDANKAMEPTLVDMGDNEYRLLWYEVNVGDCDNNGTVGIADITPIAMHYNEGYDVEETNCALALIDSSGNGVVDIADITGIAMNFETSVAGYNVYVEGTVQPNQGEPGSLSAMRPSSPGSERVDYGYTLELGGLVEVTVRPADAAGIEGVESDPAELGTGDAPAPPENLSASASQAIGPGKILLTWTANTEDDLKLYRLYRTDGECAYEKVATILATTVPLMYTDNNDGILLDPGKEFSYYLTAVDEDGFESMPSNNAVAMPYFPEPPTTPIGLAATDETDPYGLSVIVSWNESTSPHLDGYELFRKAEGDADFMLCATVGTESSPQYMDGGLEEGVLYTYRARAFDTYRQRSDFSNEDSSQCSPYVEVQIIAVYSPETTLDTDDSVEVTADVTNQLATITWSADAGTFPEGNEGRTVLWEAPADAAKPLVSVYATDGTSEDDASLGLIVTALPNLGPAIDFAKTSWQKSDPPYIAFSEYLDDKYVITLSMDKRAPG